MAHGCPDYAGDKSGIYLRPEWAAQEGTDIDKSESAANKAFGEYVEIVYPVPAAKTLYITQYSFGSTANLKASGDLPQHCSFQIEDVTATLFPVRQCADGGGGLSLSKPIRIPGGHTVDVLLINYANHACDLRVAFSGYEV